MEKIKGKPQKIVILNEDEGTVNRNDSNNRPPNPNPNPTNIAPANNLLVILDFLSFISLQNKGFLLY